MIKTLRRIYTASRKAERTRLLDQHLLSLSNRLDADKLSGATLLPSRVDMLPSLQSGGICAEVGVASGDFSAEVLKYCAPEKFYLIDAWEMDASTDYGVNGMEKVEQRFSKEIESGQVELHRGWSWERLEALPDASLDWVYIDAAHDYESVHKDLAVAVKKIKPSGVIAGHDYVRWGRFGQRFGVMEAVNEFMYQHDFRLLFLTVECDYNPSYAIRRS